jgi:hypothetical protein
MKRKTTEARAFIELTISIENSLKDGIFRIFESCMKSALKTLVFERK